MNLIDLLYAVIRRLVVTWTSMVVDLLLDIFGVKHSRDAFAHSKNPRVALVLHHILLLVVVSVLMVLNVMRVFTDASQ